MASSGSDTRRGGAVDGYQPSLDGVRALAVTAVLLYHAGVPWLPGGFLGVDAFFVLSGFLITSLLLAERARHGRVRLVAFWGRRARRLLPAALVMLAGTAIAGRYLLPPLDLGLLRGDEFAAIGYVANWRMIYRGADYFAQTAAASPVQHTWSLSIEEQFYLVWPLLLVGVLALRRRSGRRLLLTLACAGALASALAAALLYHPTNPNRAYFGTDSRAQALLVGCALALLLARSPARDAAAPAAGVPAQAGPPALEAAAAPARHRVLGLLAGLGALVFAVECWRAGGSSGWLYRGGLALCALAVAAVLAHATRSPGSPTARLLSLVPLVWLGRISYGVYLYHWPLFEYLDAGRTGLSGLGLLALRLTAVLVVATLSYHLIEQPIRRGRWLRVARPVIPAGAALLAAA
ncbi:MAG TPA: acyltransferase, partial [Rugosimonospora sp.]|nr:acyltransferase [Rugosimonospora sp.]